MLEKIIKNKTIYAVASIVIGVVMIVKGGRIAGDLIRVVGWLMIGMGAAYAASYFFGEDRDEVQLGYAILAAAGGLTVVLLANTIVNLFPILAGILLIVNGVVNITKISGETDATASSKGTAIAVIILGVLVIFFGKALISAAVVIMGICLVLNGLAELNVIHRFW